MPSLGQKLRQEREKRGLSIEQLSAQTRINVQYFQYIEADDTASLPGGFFYRSFVRQYARLMELPESDYQATLDQSLADESAQSVGRATALPDRPIEVPPIPTGRFDAALELRRWAWRLGVLVLVIALCSGVYTFWERWGLQREEERIAAARVEPPAQKPAEKQQTAPQPPPVAPVTPPPAEQPAPLQASILPQTAEIPASGAVRLIIRATEMTWVAVWQGDKQLFADVIRPGETRGFGSPNQLRIRLGNAGGVQMEWNGQAVDPVGPKGQVRTVVFRPDGYSVVQPPPPPTETKPDGQG
ncbi:RodZ domain-containing protein [uncultured Paludibaculum sp.]|uniref:helix-turn-helix domain-containing protein n=1 Tax=uncultured Paludibaculum sp. TaxID=1765020 RepID=UPI002AAB2B9F|nr:RodZ domain-containing protein [uncultured Paludibaculum sp.]